MEDSKTVVIPVIQLEPFVHQVGGHSSMLSLDAGTVCKPLVARELRFYQTLPDAVRHFTPAFYGIIQVRIEQQDDDGYVTLVATPPQFYRPRSSPANSKLSRIRLRRNGSIEIEGGGEEGKFEGDDEAEKGPLEKATVRRISASHNPWSLRCHRDNLKALIGSYTKTRLQNFILLENLTSKFSLPCVLDLKMGTRQYGDLATPAKRHSKMMKVANTTSGRIGLRLGGMQVYQVTTKHYLCRNKFHGRELTVNGFEQTLYQFLHNGKQIRADIVPLLIKQLQQLTCVLEQQEAFRFYTSSLLIIYDGDCNNSLETKPILNADEECSSGGKTSLDVLGRSVSTDTMSYATLKRNNFERSYSLEQQIEEAESIKREGQLVDVRIIDFAHSTHKGLSDPIQYTGPDQGFLFGLENLLSILKNIQSLC